MEMRIMVGQGVNGDCMLTASWPPEANQLGIGTEVLWRAVANIGMPPKSFATFPDSAVFSPPPGEAMRYLQGMLDALKQHPATSKLTVHVKWSSPELRDAIMKIEEM